MGLILSGGGREEADVRQRGIRADLSLDEPSPEQQKYDTILCKHGPGEILLQAQLLTASAVHLIQARWMTGGLLVHAVRWRERERKRARAETRFAGSRH